MLPLLTRIKEAARHPLPNGKPSVVEGPPPPPGYTRHQHTLKAGPTLDYVTNGNTEGVSLLLVHGWPDSWRSFEHLLPLVKQYNTFAVSLRGFGDSDSGGLAPSEHGVARMALDLDMFIEELGIGPVVLVGHSMGAVTCSYFACCWPSAVSHLLLIGATATASTCAGLVEFLPVIAAQKGPYLDRDLVRSFQEGTFFDPQKYPGFLKLIVDESLKARACVCTAALTSLLNHDEASVLSFAKMPTTVVWGEQDELFSRHEQDALVALLPDAEFCEVAEAGHSVQWDQPKAVATAIAALLKRTAKNFQEGNEAQPVSEGGGTVDQESGTEETKQTT